MVVALEDLTDVDNLGAIARHAAAFGADALLLSPRCADPFYRKAIRVSLGAVFGLPIVRAERWPDALHALRADGMTLVAAVVDDASDCRWRGSPRLPASHCCSAPRARASPPPARAACDHQVTIPMGAAADSLNVATAAAIFLYALTATASASAPEIASKTPLASPSRLSLRGRRWARGPGHRTSL